MKRPREIKVGAFCYRVRWDGRGLSRDANGECHPDRQIIIVRRGLTDPTARLVLFHECLHAVWADCGLTDGVDEETAVTRLANGALALFADNPGLAEFLGILTADSA